VWETSIVDDTGPGHVSPGQLAWLATELPIWQGAGLVGDTEAAAILGRYQASRRLSLGRLMLYLGGAFVGVGLLWLVAANLDQFPPIGRFLVVTALWLGVTAAAELLAARAAHGPRSPVVGSARGLSSLAFGAVISQAAQSLQVPAYEPSLVGLWSLGALLYAYAVRGVAPLIVGLAAGVGWFVWHVAENSGSGLGVVLALVAAGAAAAALAVLHQGRIREFVDPWREMGAVLVLSGLFIAALPSITTKGFAPDALTWVVLGLGLLLVVVAVATGEGSVRYEPLAALAVVLVATLLVLWDSGEPVDGRVSPADWAHAALSVAVYVVVSAWVAVLGILRGSNRLTWLALVALVIFTTVQSFAVFAPIIDGAWLFLVLGLIFLGSGYLFDRARRELASTLEGEAA